MFGVLIIAWILAQFGCDEVVISGINELLGTHCTNNTYGLLAIAIGVIVEIISYAKKKHK